jgi:hypothetical protein
METVRELNPQLTCDRILTLDPRILYSSCLDLEGRRIGEAIEDAIDLYGELTVVLLPLDRNGGSLVLAVPIGSDLREIVTKAKKIFSDETKAF